MPSAATDQSQRSDSVSDGESAALSYLRDPHVQLMLRARHGDEAAFAELVLAYQDRLIGIFQHILHDREAAEDLAQETFLRVHRARGTYEPTARFSTWLFRIANNLASNSRRTKGRRRETTFEQRDSQPVAVRPEERLLADKSALMPTRLADRAELQAVVRRALDGLSERQRMALLLHKYEDMSYADIGETMEMTATAVKSLLARARDALRDKLEPYVNRR